MYSVTDKIISPTKQKNMNLYYRAFIQKKKKKATVHDLLFYITLVGKGHLYT